MISCLICKNVNDDPYKKVSNYNINLIQNSNGSRRKTYLRSKKRTPLAGTRQAPIIICQ